MCHLVYRVETTIVEHTWNAGHRPDCGGSKIASNKNELLQYTYSYNPLWAAP